MTGILPIKKYGTHSAINIFDEFSMTNPRDMSQYVGFTETEVKELCQQFNMSFNDVQGCYNGYQFTTKKRKAHSFRGGMDSAPCS